MRTGLLQSLGLKWKIAIAYWAVLCVVAYFLTAAWYAMSGSVDGPAGDYIGLDGLADLGLVMTHAPFNVFMGVCCGAFIGLQLLLLLPARFPTRAATGAPLWLTIGAASLLAAGLVVALFAAIIGLLGEYDLLDSFPIDSWTGLIAVVLLHWAVMTPLVAAFVRRQDGEGVARRLSMILFVGSVVDVAAMIPLDVMIRRKTNCYSWSTSMFSLGTAAAIGLLALGPAVWLPITCRRRRRWLETSCGACGYDMTGGGERCPECGTPFRALERSAAPQPEAP